jgi:hypothetical protein
MRGDSGFWQLECFVLNSDDITFDTNEKIKIEPIILNVNSNDIRQYYVNPKSYIENIDEFLFNQAIQFTKNKIKHEFYKILEKKEMDLMLWYQIDLVEKDANHLIGLHMRGICNDDLDKIYTITRNRKLSEFIGKIKDVAPFDVKVKNENS